MKTKSGLKYCVTGDGRVDEYFKFLIIAEAVEVVDPLCLDKDFLQGLGSCASAGQKRQRVKQKCTNKTLWGFL